jgi:glycosyltransferase involved in cell wall biosynthesis/2-polyprenyl-3-methyl-5-hydroxy-6-metoxy-1,4-benzoquinol methylase
MDRGGAAKAALRLQAGLLGAGLSSTMLVMTKKYPDPRVRVILPAAGAQTHSNSGESFAGDEKRWDSVCRRFSSLLAPYGGRSRRLEIFTDADAETRLAAVSEIQSAEVVVLHWVAGLLDYAEFKEAFQGKKVVWVFHDLNPMTGGCHYPDGCMKYRTGCGACPQLGSADALDLSRRVWSQKMECLAGCEYTIVTPSRWLGECAAASPIHRWKKIVCIPNGLPLDLFRPHARAEIRQELGLSHADPVLLFGADSLANPRKGFAYLRAAIKSYRQRYNRDLTLVCFGEVPAGFDPQMDCRLFLTGFLRDETQLARLFSLADAYVIPSLEENLPNTAVEALACGLPVVGFRTGGMPEIVSHEATGHLAARFHPDSLADSLAWCLEPGRREQMKDACRQKAVSTYALERQTNAYIELFRQAEPLSGVLKTADAAKRHCESSISVRELPRRSQKEQEVRSTSWFHRIDLGEGLLTPGRDDSERKLKSLGMPEKLSGLSVLDIDAWDGYFSFAAEKRGAAKVVAADLSTAPGFNVAKRLLQSQVSAIEMDVMDLDPEKIGTFDLVLCLGVLYHLKHPLMALERICSVTAGQLILETYVDMLDCPRPAMAFYPGDELNGDPTNWCGPNPAMVVAMLRIAGFQRAEIFSDTRSGDRYAENRAVFHAWK